MSAYDPLPSRVHRLRSTLMRLRLELESCDGLSYEDETRMLRTVDELVSLVGDDTADAAARPTVVVVDDDQELAELTARALTRFGYRAHSGSEVRDAQAIAGEIILVLDLSVLAGSTQSDIAWVRAHRPILMTGASSTRAAEIAKEVDARSVLTKPIASAALAAALAHAVGEGRA